MALGALYALGACAGPMPQKHPPAAPHESVRDDATPLAPEAFCKVAKPLTLAILDSPETQTEIRLFNATYAAHCPQERAAHEK